MNVPTLFLLLATVRGASGLDIARDCPSVQVDVQTCVQTSFNESTMLLVQLYGNQINVLDSTPFLGKSLLPKMCGVKDQLKNFYTCFLMKLFACLAAQSKLYPSVDSVQKSMDYLCDHITDVDLSCISDVVRRIALRNCVIIKQQGRTSSVAKAPDSVCSIHEMTLSCLGNTYRTCPSKTADILETYFKYHRPQACSACFICQSALMILFINTVSFMTNVLIL